MRSILNQKINIQICSEVSQPYSREARMVRIYPSRSERPKGLLHRQRKRKHGVCSMRRSANGKNMSMSRSPISSQALSPSQHLAGLSSLAPCGFRSYRARRELIIKGQ